MYELIEWENWPSTATPRGATNFNHMDQGIYDAHLLAGTPVHVSANYTASVGDHVVVDADGYSGASPVVVTLPAEPEDGSTVTVSATNTTSDAAVNVVVAEGASLRVGDNSVFPFGVRVAVGTSVRFIYSESDEAWDIFGTFIALTLGVAKLSTDAIAAEGDPGETTFLRGDGLWASIDRNPVFVTAAHESSPGEDVYASFGGYAVTIPDGTAHGQIITVSTGYHLAATADVDVEYFNLGTQSTEVTTLPYAGAKVTLQWLQDVEWESSTVSGWMPTTVALIDTVPSL